MEKQLRMQYLLRISLKVLFVLLASIASLHAEHIFSVGPEFYYLKRVREGGTEQSGRMDGLRVGYDRIVDNSWYLGGEFFASQGRLKGDSSYGRPLHSVLKDLIYEGRLGYTFSMQPVTYPSHRSFFTPFGGYGHFHETNAFKAPSPIPFTFVDTFNYFVAGFLSGINFNPLLSMGINFKVDFMIDPTSKVEDDPLYEDITLKMKKEINVRLDIPFAYRFCFLKRSSMVLLAPFYEFRHFGGQVGFPFDFIDTKFYLVGAKLQLGLTF